MNRQLHRTEWRQNDRTKHLLVFGPVVSYCSRATGDYQLTFISDNVGDQWGYSVQSCLQTPRFWLDLVHPMDLNTVQHLLKYLLPNAPQCCEYRIRHADGSYRWIQNHLQLMPAYNQASAEIVGCWQDITERKQLETARAQQEQLLQGIITSNHQVLTHANFHAGLSRALAIIGTATAADRVYICDSHGAEGTGTTKLDVRYAWTRDEVTLPIHQLPWEHQPLAHFQSMQWYQMLRKNLPLCSLVRDLSGANQALFKGARIQSILLLPIFFDSQFWGFIGIDHCQVEHQWSPQDVPLLLTWAATVGGVLQRHQSEAQLVHHAFHDPLTGLPNRSLLMNRLEQALAQTKRYPDYMFAVMFLDLDHFKAINDNLGHNIGDRLLVAIAKRLSNCLRPGDTVARLGGDEFVVLLHDIQALEDATVAAERLRDQVNQPFQLGAHEIFANLSIGITLSSNDYESAEAILGDADQAMYQAKISGKGRHRVFDSETSLAQPSTDSAAYPLLPQSVTPLKFVLYFQPIFSLASGQIRGLQVLSHWGHVPQQHLNPTDFWKRTTHTSLPPAVGLQVLQQACTQTVKWHQALPHFPLNLSIHLNSQQLLQPKFLQNVQRILEESHLHPQNLRLELSNTAILDSQGLSASILTELNGLGIQLYLSDFGNNCSALRYLYQLPISAVKIDRAVIGQISSADEGNALVRSLILLAHNLAIDVIAEGIETTAQLKYLQALNCPYGQGFLLHPPLTVTEMTDLLKQGYALPTFTFPSMATLE